jgi:N-acetylmuramoyl-L-alanine amidase
MVIKRIEFWGIVFLCAVFAGALSSDASAAKDSYAKADASYHKLLNSPEKQKLRHNWIQCIDEYQAVYKSDPNGPKASAGLYMVGYLYDELYRVSKKISDKKEAIDCYERVIKRYPKSSHMPKAKAAIERLSHPEICNPTIKSNSNQQKSDKAVSETEKSNGNQKKTNKVASEYVKSNGSQQKSNKIVSESDQTVSPVSIESSCPPLSGYTRITDLRVWSNPSYTRIVIDADKETTFEHRVLKKDPALDKPQRLYIDFNQSKLAKSFKSFIPIDDDLLLDARAGQYTLESVRVVVDIKSFKSYKIFSLNSPFRIILDIWGDESGAVQADKSSAPGLDSVEDQNRSDTRNDQADKYSPPGSDSHRTTGKTTGKRIARNTGKHSKIDSGALAKQLALGVSRIIIDPGHGGKDFGAPGAIEGVFEKDITLSIGKKLAAKIRNSLNCEVILTRTTDRYVTLEERTAIANTKNGDLFISIHANAAKNQDAFGIETFFLNLATDDESIAVAARENATSTKNISDLQSILTDLMQNAKVNESSRLAARVQDNLCDHMSIKYSNIKNKGVKKAPFYVLLGAQMPSILVETSFISNQRECARLASPEYQDRLCDAIIAGVGRYIKDINPTAFYDKKGLGSPSS